MYQLSLHSLQTCPVSRQRLRSFLLLNLHRQQIYLSPEVQRRGEIYLSRVSLLERFLLLSYPEVLIQGFQRVKALLERYHFSRVNCRVSLHTIFRAVTSHSPLSGLIQRRPGDDFPVVPNRQLICHLGFLRVLNSPNRGDLSHQLTCHHRKICVR